MWGGDVVFEEAGEEVDFGDDGHEGLAVGQDGVLARAGDNLEDAGFVGGVHEFGVTLTHIGQANTIIGEIEAYAQTLADKPRVTVLNKVDALDPETIAARATALAEASGGPVMGMSGVAREGVTEVLRRLRAEIDEDRLRQKPQEEAEPWRP